MESLLNMYSSLYKITFSNKHWREIYTWFLCLVSTKQDVVDMYGKKPLVTVENDALMRLQLPSYCWSSFSTSCRGRCFRGGWHSETHSDLKYIHHQEQQQIEERKWNSNHVEFSLVTVVAILKVVLFFTLLIAVMPTFLQENGKNQNTITLHLNYLDRGSKVTYALGCTFLLLKFLTC